MKKTISCLLIFSVLLSIFAVPAFAKEPESNLKFRVMLFHDYRASGNSLTAETTEIKKDYKPLTAAYSETGMRVSGEIEGTPCDISVPITGGSFSEPADLENNYRVLSVMQLDSYVRIVLQNRTAPDMVYLDCYNLLPASQKVENYNQNWYNEFISGEIIKEDLPVPYAKTGTRYVEYISTTTAFGGTIAEHLIAMVNNEWPEEINDDTGGEFRISLGIKENYTEMTLTGESKKTLRGSSLAIHDAKAYFATPKGDYISRINTSFIGIISTPGHIKINYSMAIPKTGFSIAYVYPSDREIGNGANGEFTFSRAEEEKVVQARVNWTDSERYLTNEATGEKERHQYKANAKLETNTNYEQLGGKILSTRWEYQVYSRGNCHGYGVNLYAKYDSMNCNLYYDLID